MLVNKQSKFIYYLAIGGVGRVFANGPGCLDSILVRVIPKTQKMVLNTSLLNSQQCKVCIKVKWSNSGKGITPSLTPRCSSYWKVSLLVAFDYGRQHYFTYYLFHNNSSQEPDNSTKFMTWGPDSTMWQFLIEVSKVKLVTSVEVTRRLTSQ